MDVIKAFQELLNADFRQLIIAIVGIMVAMVVIKKFWEEFLNIFNIETPAKKKEKERKEELNQIKCQLDYLKQQQEEIKAKSESSDKRMEEKIDKIEDLMNSHIIATMRSTLWRIYSESMRQGYISREGLKTFTECGKVYEKSGGDDIYHEKLHPEIMNLEVRD